MISGYAKLDPCGKAALFCMLHVDRMITWGPINGMQVL